MWHVAEAGNPQQEEPCSGTPCQRQLLAGKVFQGHRARAEVLDKTKLHLVSQAQQARSLLSNSALSRSPCNYAPVGSICRANGTFHFPVVLDAPTPLKVLQVWETCKSCIPWFARMRSACNLHPGGVAALIQHHVDAGVVL